MNAIALLLCAVVTIPSIPDVIARSRPGPPVWVSAASAFDGTGEFRGQLLEPHSIQFLDSARQKNAGRCNVFTPPPVLEDFTAKDSLDSLAGYSLTIIKARVVAGAAGFDNGIAGTLFALRVDETYKSIGQAATKGPLYVFFGETTISTAKGLICARVFAGVPLPSVGDDVIVFCSLLPIDDEQRILHIDEGRQLVVQHDGHLYLPRGINKLAPADIDDLGALIRDNPHLHESHPRIGW